MKKIKEFLKDMVKSLNWWFIGVLFLVVNIFAEPSEGTFINPYIEINIAMILIIIMVYISIRMRREPGGKTIAEMIILEKEKELRDNEKIKEFVEENKNNKLDSELLLKIKRIVFESHKFRVYGR